MKTTTVSRVLKSVGMLIPTLALSGCFQSEAERFGYKGDDLEGVTNKVYLVTSEATTNWVPERVLNIYENYEFTSDELNVLKTAGVLTPCAEYAKFPSGYTCTIKEPWYETWTESTTAFDLNGTVGVFAHFNEDRKVFETSETYFSTYWKTREEAVAALAKIEEILAKTCQVKKFHKFNDGWVAEYVRLFVMGVVGKKEDGTWSCMLDFRDKGRYGCGPWEPVVEQQDRRNRYVYRKEMIAWRQALATIWSKNLELVLARAKERGISEMTNVAEWTAYPFSDRGHLFCSRTAEITSKTPSTEVASEIAKEIWTNEIAKIEKEFKFKFAGEPTIESNMNNNDIWMAISTTNDLFEINYRLYVPVVAKEKEEELEDEVMAKKEDTITRPSTPYGRLDVIALLQKGFTLPPKPVLKEVQE